MWTFELTYAHVLRTEYMDGIAIARNIFRPADRWAIYMLRIDALLPSSIVKVLSEYWKRFRARVWSASAVFRPRFRDNHI